jgi:acetyl esterase
VVAAFAAIAATMLQNISLDLVEAGIVVLAIEFRNSPEAPYRAALQDINYGIRWLKAHAPKFGSSADRIGILGTSAGGLLAALAAMRPDDPRYRALPLADAPDTDAKLAFMISAWGVLFPLDRYNIAKAKGDQDMVRGREARGRKKSGASVKIHSLFLQ